MLFVRRIFQAGVKPFLYMLKLNIIILISFFTLTIKAQENEKIQNDYEDFDPANFDESSINITNEWFPLNPLTQFVYEGSTLEDNERIPHRVIFTVTDYTKTIGGVKTVVCWDQDYADGVLEESELVFFAQDKNGNVWHLGQYPEELDEDGKLVDAPCWLHGFEDAIAGIIMKADPKINTPSYSQGWALSVDWTDRGKVHLIGQKTTVPAGSFEDVLVIDETARSEPDAHQLKYYAMGVGSIRVGWWGEGEVSQEELELVEIRKLILGALDETRSNVLRLEKRANENSKDVYGKTEPMVQRSDN